jgi:hypothetical protein
VSKQDTRTQAINSYTGVTIYKYAIEEGPDGQKVYEEVEVAEGVTIRKPHLVIAETERAALEIR